MDDTIGIVGVGLMGHGIARNILKAGYPLGFLSHPGNRPTADLTAAGAWTAETPAALAARCDVVILCVTGTPQVEAVLTGAEGVLETLRPGAVVIDCSTALPESTRRMAALVRAAGAEMLDAPMTRTPKEAAGGRLNLIVGGPRPAFEARRALLDSFAEHVTHAGETGAGHTLKLLHNYVSLGFSAVLAEAVAASGRAGIAPEVLRTVLAHGGGAGVILDRLSPFILEGDDSGFRFSLANAFKDMDYYAAMVAGLDSPAEIAAAIRDAYGAQVDCGEGDRFVPELIALFADPAAPDPA